MKVKIRILKIISGVVKVFIFYFVIFFKFKKTKKILIYLINFVFKKIYMYIFILKRWVYQ
jgi:hypothetical protein